jgi:hypothetical protein
MTKILVISYTYSIDKKQIEINTDKGLENSIEYKIENYLKGEFNDSMVLHKNSNNEWWNFKNSRQLIHDANVRALQPLFCYRSNERKICTNL